MTLLILSLYGAISAYLAFRLSKKLDYLSTQDRLLMLLMMAPVLPVIMSITISSSIIRRMTK